ncbi:MAG TPA: PBP1A family penicillin-binding protein [Acetobacteraceae bacterium]|jgi:penicillin-binding protein 1A|nr:PBP1A family penicillin-binding protein [Acetobacteraceae bacterium]
MNAKPTPRARLATASSDPHTRSPGPRRNAAPPPRRRRRNLFGRIVGALFGLIALIALAGAGALYIAYAHYSAGLPDLNGLRNYQPHQMSRVYAGDSRLLAELATERRIFVPYSAIPDIVRHAFLSAEDQNFFNHGGVDPLAIIRAAVTDVSQYGQGRRPVGASTITQQVGKNMLLGNEVSFSRKIREALLAMRIERSLSKERILELYLNEIYLGLGAYGVASAAQTYFNKSLDELTIPEAAFLAALPKAPNNYNPLRFPDAARARRDWVIDRMTDDHVITAEQAAAAKAAPVTTSPYQRPETVTGANYFAEEVRRQLVTKFGQDLALQGGLVVHTSLNPTMQTLADKVLRDGLLKYDREHGGWRGPAGHLDTHPATLATSWATDLAAVAPPPGMLPEWRFGVVISETNGEAQVGILDHPPGPAAPTEQRVLPMPLSDLGWAHPVHDGHIGPSPRRMSDVIRVGDLVMVEPTGAGKQGKAILRQIPAVEGAMVIMDPTTGRVLAMSGGWSFEMSQFNRASQGLRQPGSSFKPFVYLTAMEQDISPSQIFLDEPFTLDLGAQGVWKPNNYSLNFNGPIPLRIALEKSLNLVTVRLAQKVGMANVAKTAIAFHEVDSMPKVLPAALGAVETTVLREAAAYSGLDMGGKEVLPSVIDTVQDRDGHVIWRPAALACDGCNDPSKTPTVIDNRKQIADPPSVFQVVNMMEGVVARGTGYAAGKGLDRAIAGKTGTTQDFNDAWFAGFTPDLAAVVWVGFDNPASLGKDETGSALAVPIWHDFMQVALKDRPNLKFVPPPGVTMASWDSGYGTVTDAFKPGQQPGASGPMGGSSDGATVASSADAAATARTIAPHAAGVDTGLGGLY